MKQNDDCSEWQHSEKMPDAVEVSRSDMKVIVITLLAHCDGGINIQLKFN